MAGGLIQMHSFDDFADDYVAINDRYSWFFREKTGYFADYKASYVARLVGPSFTGAILDFGCGIGLVTNRLTARLPLARIDGLDSSPASIARARRDAHANARVRYIESDDALAPPYDVVIMANVLHHLAPVERESVLRRVHELLAPGGRLVIFEHNTWNPLVMLIVRKHPFDSDAVFVSPREASKLVRSAGLTPSIDFIVFFPAFFKIFRPAERHLRWLPIGGQYACIGRKEP